MRRRVLSIQGGGVNGIFAAKLIACIESDLEQKGLPCRIGRYFDLITGTSTGGVIALALALEVPAMDIVQIYESKSARIFPGCRRNIVWKMLRRLRPWPFYSPGPLIEELRRVFGDRSLSDAKTRILIPAFNQSTNSVQIFKTAHHEIFSKDHKLKAWDIAAATAAAPFYFPPHTMENNVSFLDGGVWANNPILIAVVECIQYCRWDRNRIDIFSIGGVRDVISESYWQKILGLPGALLRAQVKGSLATAKTLLGDVNEACEPHGTVFDLTTDVPTGGYQMDDARSVQDLLGKAETVYRSRGSAIHAKFFSAVAEDFKPVYSNCPGSAPMAQN